ncbi:MAG: penicillin acylase family protein [Candidatus Hydrogenedentes bacterium]|nr:penicillin acylase family protein [Candidatus Hydrogenedentota bacterium]
MLPFHRTCVLLGLLAIPAAGAFAQDPLPNPEDLWGQATLYRDAWGVPHVYADTPRAMAFAFGYAQAADKLPTIALAYRVAQGRAAEVFGERYAGWDAFSLKAGHLRVAERALPQMDPLTQDLCAGFALGVNAWISEHPDQVAPWIEAVTPVDVLAFWHCVMVSMAPFDLPGVFRPPRAMESGSAWAVAANRMEEGAAALVINPHMHFDGPFQWYEGHLASGDLDVSGVTLAGLPVILQGHNRRLGWALTPSEADSADMFHMRVIGPRRSAGDPRIPDPRDAQAPLLEYLSNTQRYFVKTDLGMQERYVPVVDDEIGPIFEGADGQLYAWLVGGYRNLGGFVQLIEMARAQTLEGFQAALGLQQLPTCHVTYADDQGNLFYLYNAISGLKAIPEPGTEQDPNPPLRNIDWHQPVDAMWALDAWRETVPITELPYVINPESGYIQACGNPPWTVTDGQPLDPAYWPGWLAPEIDSWRAQRVRQLLRTGKRSFRDMQSIVYDAVVPAAVELAPKLLAWADAREGAAAQAHPDLPSALNLLRGWNHLADTQSTAMTFYHLWWSAMQTHSAGDVPSEAALYNALLLDAPEAANRSLRAAADAVRMMRNEYDAVEMPWGEVHRIKRGEREEGVDGASTGDPVFVASDQFYQDGKWWATYGTGYAMAVQFGDQPEAVSVHIFGASDQADSPHFDDQLDLVLEKRFKYTDFARQDVWRYSERALGRKLGFYPEGVSAELLVLAAEPVWAGVASVVEAPALLPAGLVTYTIFIKPSIEPEAVPVRSNLRVYVPPELCAPEDLPLLSLYGWSAGPGWVPLPNQTFDPESQIFSGAAEGPGVFAVLGPPEPRDRAGQPPAEEGAPVEGAAPEPAPAPEAAPVPEAAPQPEEERVFKFERLDGGKTADEADTPAPAGSAMPPEFSGRPIGQRQFRVIRLDEPSDSNSESEGTPAEDASPAPVPPVPEPAAEEESFGAGPTGQRQFKFKRLDQSVPAEAPAAPATMPDDSAAPASPPVPAAEPALAPVPEATPPPPGAPAPPAAADEPIGNGPTGKRQFKFKRLDQE